MVSAGNKAKRLCRSTIPQKQFIIITIIISLLTTKTIENCKSFLKRVNSCYKLIETVKNNKYRSQKQSKMFYVEPIMF